MVHGFKGLGSALQEVLYAVKCLHCAAYKEETSPGQVENVPLSDVLLTLHDIYGHQAHSGWQEHVARCVHCNCSTNTMTDQDDWWRRLAVAGLDHIGYIARSGMLIQSLHIQF